MVNFIQLTTNEKLLRRNEELKLLKSVGEAFNSILSLDNVLDKVLKEIQELLGVLCCSVWLIDPVTKELVCKGSTDRVNKGVTLEEGVGLNGWAVKHKKSLIVADAPTDKRHFTDISKKSGVVHRSILTVPLLYRRNVLGTLQIIDESKDQFNKSILKLVELLATSAAIAIRNAQIYDIAQKEIRTRKEVGEIVQELSSLNGKTLEEALHRSCIRIAKLLNVEEVVLCSNMYVIASSRKIVTLLWKRDHAERKPGMSLDKCPSVRNSNSMFFKMQQLSTSKEIVFQLIIKGSKRIVINKGQKETLKIIANNVSLVLERAVLEDHKETLKTITDKVIFIDPEVFQQKVNQLGRKSFTATYLMADAVDSVKHGLDQTKLQKHLKKILVNHGAIWGNAWGDMMHCFFSDYFDKSQKNHILSGYSAAIQICTQIKEELGCTMRVGIATGQIKVNKDTIQMNQVNRSKIIEKAWIAQEGRKGITTLQRPSSEIKREIKKLGYEFKESADLVRGEMTSIWKLYPIKKLNKPEVKIKNRTKRSRNNSSELPYVASLKVLLTKGVCGHGHLEGSPITSDIGAILQKVIKLYKVNPDLSKRFETLTGKTHTQIFKEYKRIEAWGESRKNFDFVKHFLPWLYIGKLCEASSPEIIYELTKVQLEHDIKSHAGFTREIYPLVWLEMGLDFDECIKAFVQGTEDVLTSNHTMGPIQIGVGVPRQHLVRRLSKEVSPYLSHITMPYLESLKLVRALKASKVAVYADIFVDLMHLARSNPLFNHKKHTTRGNHTEAFYREAKTLDVGIQVHLLEELVDRDMIGKDQDRTKELPFILDLFEKLKIQNARLIHMAYWSEDIPHLDRIKKAGHEIIVCPTSTRMLGSTHKPVSPFLLQNKKVIEGVVYDNKFPQIIISTDDAGPFGIKNVWEELLTTYHDVEKWHGKHMAALSLIQFLRNGYQGMTPKQIAKKYHLNEKAVNRVLSYDLYSDKKFLRNHLVVKAVERRVKKLLEQRDMFLSKM